MYSMRSGGNQQRGAGSAGCERSYSSNIQHSNPYSCSSRYLEHFANSIICLSVLTSDMYTKLY